MCFRVFGVFWAIYWCFECFYEIQCRFLYIWTDLKIYYVIFRKLKKKVGPKTVLKLIQNGSLPSPSPASAKVSCQEANTKQNVDAFLWFAWEKSKKYPARGLKKGSPRKNKNSSVFPRASKKRKSNTDVKHDHGQEKRIPSALCWGK